MEQDEERDGEADRVGPTGGGFMTVVG